MDESMSLSDQATGEVFLKRNQAARLLGITGQRVGVLLRAGRFPGAHRVGLRGDWRVPVREVLGFKRLKVGRKPKGD